jgi:hypothetical protein
MTWQRCLPIVSESGAGGRLARPRPPVITQHWFSASRMVSVPLAAERERRKMATALRIRGARRQRQPPRSRPGNPGTKRVKTGQRRQARPVFNGFFSRAFPSYRRGRISPPPRYPALSVPVRGKNATRAGRAFSEAESSHEFNADCTIGLRMVTSVLIAPRPCWPPGPCSPQSACADRRPACRWSRAVGSLQAAARRRATRTSRGGSAAPWPGTM